MTEQSDELIKAKRRHSEAQKNLWAFHAAVCFVSLVGIAFGLLIYFSTP